MTNLLVVEVADSFFTFHLPRLTMFPPKNPILVRASPKFASLHAPRILLPADV